MSDEAAVPEAADELFDLAVGEFVAARNELATRLTADGDPGAARAVRALRRPTLAAWAVNQAVRADADAWQRLVTAGRVAQQAQRKALSGVRDSSLRSATAERRVHIEAMVDLATAALERAGASSASHADAIASTFEAASANPDLADLVGRGRLSAPVAPTTDFGDLTGLLAVPSRVAGPSRDGEDPRDEDRDTAATQRRTAMRALEAANQRVEATQRVLDKAEQAARDLADRATGAQRRADDAQAAAERSQAAAVTATARASEAAAARDGAARDSQIAIREAQEARAALDALA